MAKTINCTYVTSLELFVPGKTCRKSRSRSIIRSIPAATTIGIAAAQSLKSDDARIYPCADCGVMRSKNEGGTTFTVCDQCWDRHYLKYRKATK